MMTILIILKVVNHESNMHFGKYIFYKKAYSTYGIWKRYVIYLVGKWMLVFPNGYVYI